MSDIGSSFAALSRRRVLEIAGGGCVAALVGAGASPAWAARTVKDGNFEATVVSDGNLVLPASFVFPKTPEADRSRLLSQDGYPTDVISPDCNVTLLRTKDRLAIFDAGSGPNFMPSAGKLAKNLAQLGVSPDDVTDVIFTHAHPDHFWGITDEFDELVFKKATYRIPKAELDYWRASDTLAKSPEDRKTFVVGAQSRLPLIEDRLEPFAAGAEVIPGVESVDTNGHTPGHVSFVVHGGRDPLVIMGDVASNPVSFEQPDWRWGTDHDPDQGVVTRKKLLDRLVADHARLIGFHLLHPGVGAAERSGGAFRFAPQA